MTTYIGKTKANCPTCGRWVSIDSPGPLDHVETTCGCDPRNKLVAGFKGGYAQGPLEHVVFQG